MIKKICRHCPNPPKRGSDLCERCIYEEFNKQKLLSKQDPPSEIQKENPRQIKRSEATLKTKTKN